MTIVAGTGPANEQLIQSTIASALKLPGEVPMQPVNTEAQPAQPQAPVNQAPVENVSQAATDAAASVEVPNFFEEKEPPANEETPPTEDTEQAASDSSEGGESDVDDSDLPDTPAAENFKRLRESVKAERAAKKQLLAEFNETKSKLEKYEKGEIKPEILSAKDQRIAELEKYEKVVNLKLSREYQEKFVQPAVSLRQQLEKYGEDYGVPKELLHRAVEITNRRDLNTFLSRHFDEVGALEVKKVIGDLHKLGEEAIQAEQSPQETLQSLKAQFAEKEQEETRKRHTVFEHTARNAWAAALEKTQKEGAYKELVMSPTDPEFNEKYVKPIQEKAAVQYGALVKQLAQHGLKNLPPELATGLARMVLLSIGGAFTLEAKEKAIKQANNIMVNTQRITPYMRPSVGGQNGVAHQNRAPEVQGPMTPKDAGKLATNVFKGL